MNPVLILFPLGDYPSQTDGSARVYLIDERLCEVLGQAKSILFHHRVEDKSANNAGAMLRVSHASLAGCPSEVAVGCGDLDLTQQDMDIQVLEGPFAGRVFVKLEIVDKSVPPATQKVFRLEIGATLILD